MMKIICTQSNAFSQTLFADLGDVELVADDDLSPQALRGAKILITRTQKPITADLLRHSNIKFVGTTTSGSDHVDKAYLKERHIHFADAIGSNAISVAQYALIALLYWAEKHNLNPVDLTVGIIGYGYVGQLVKHYLSLLGAKVLVNDPILFDAGHLPSHQSLQEIYKAADVISLHASFNESGIYQTKNLINKTAFSLMQKKPVLINVARGDMIEPYSLHEAIATQQVSDVILDVWPGEPFIEADLVAKAFLATPHIAGHSYLAKLRGAYQVYCALCKYLGKPINTALQTLDISNKKIIATQDLSLSQILLSVFPIDKLSEQMKSWPLAYAKLDKPFKEFRRNYHGQDEFSQVTVDRMTPLLRELGFNANE